MTIREAFLEAVQRGIVNADELAGVVLDLLDDAQLTEVFEGALECVGYEADDSDEPTSD